MKTNLILIISLLGIALLFFISEIFSLKKEVRKLNKIVGHLLKKDKWFMNQDKEQPNNDLIEENPSKVYALFYSFFLIPFMIAIFGALFFFMFQFLTY